MNVSFSSSRQRNLMGEINIIPLVDVVLVLLIIFMVTAPLLVRGIDMNLPQTQTNTLRPEKRFTVNILKNGVVILDQEKISVSQLPRKLVTLQGQAVYLRADQDVPYGDVIRVLDLIKQARIDQIGLMTEMPRDPHAP